MEDEYEMQEVIIEDDSKSRKKKKKKVNSVKPTAMDRIVKDYSKAEEGSFIDPDQPGPSPAFYYNTIYIAPKRPALTSTSLSVTQGEREDIDEHDLLDQSSEDDLIEDEAGCWEKSVIKICGDKCVPLRGKKKDPNKSDKYGTWDGVVASCLLNIFGVIMFLRLPWVVGQAGMWQTTIIILLSMIITTLTTMSMSAVATNGKIGGGGAYFLISRSLGPQFGGAIGVLFSLGQCIAVTLYLIGFAETLATKMMNEWGGISITGDYLWDVRLWAIIALIMLFGMALIGVGWVIKMQIGLLLALMFVILSVFIGCIIGIKPGQGFTGFVGFNATAFNENINPAYIEGNDFFSVFSVFFPAVTGIMAGANISGDLEDAGESIPKGTLIAIFFSGIVYIIMTWFIGATTFRTLADGTGGLYFNNNIMEEMSFWAPLVLIGIFAATLSSALASLVGAPRISQAFCKDMIFKGWFIEPVERVFAWGRQPTNDPIPGYILTFGIAFGFCMIGDLNTIAPIISMFFMITYGLVNLACFAGSMTRAPGWRPSFIYYNAWLALLGALLCIVAMFLISWWAALVAVGIGAGLYILLWLRPPRVEWGPTGHAFQLNKVVSESLKLREIPFHAKVWRPHFVVLVNDRDHDSTLIRFSRYFGKGGGMTILSHVIIGEYQDKLVEYHQNKGNGYYEINYEEYYNKMNGKVKTRKKHYVAFWSVLVSRSLREGSLMMLQAGGAGKLKPNTLMMGYPERWNEASKDQRDEYMLTIRDGFETGCNCIIARGHERIDFTHPPTGTIDIWWLVDDGGFTIIIPWLLQRKRFWRGCQLRILTVPGKTSLERVAKEAALLQKLVEEFRIPATVHVEVPDILEEDEFQEILKQSPIEFPEEAHERTRRYILLSKLLEEQSSQSDLVFCTLPFPRDGVTSDNWLAWLEMISGGDMPPMVFLRGNQTSVLSIYA